MKTLTLVIGLALLALQPSSAAAQRLARERLSLNADWRFQKGDPSGAEGQLTYERAKPWVIATGNEFVSGDRKPARPEGISAMTFSTRRQVSMIAAGVN
jgi:hypothetical protein